MRFFDQIDRDLVIQEATYGFVMALTFVTATQLGFIDMEREMLVKAIIAMDFVWGMIDLIIFFNMDVIAQRRRRHELQKVYSGQTKTPREDICGMLDGTVFDDLDEESKQKAIDLIADAHLEGRRAANIDKMRYLFNSVTAFIVTLLTAVPSALCLLFIDDIWTACLYASFASCVALFFTGYVMAVSDDRRMRIVFGMFLAGSTMVLTLFAAVFGG